MVGNTLRESSSVLDALSGIIANHITPNAASVDDSGEFPRKNIDILTGAGILAITVPREHGGSGLGIEAAAGVVRQLGAACSSTAMIAMMHYSAVAAIAAGGRTDLLAEVGQRRHLTTLAFSEAGSRSHFWAPMSTARADGDDVVLDAQKSWVTSAREVDSYVWSSRPLAAEGPMTLWLVRTPREGLSVAEGFDGVGLRGNDSCPVVADGVRVAAADMIGVDGGGLDLALGAVLPCFLVLNAAAGVGCMERLCRHTAQYLTSTRLQHLDEALVKQLPLRTKLATMHVRADRTGALVAEAARAIDEGRETAALLALEAKAAADEEAPAVSDLAMTACGGSAFKRGNDIERGLRDSRAARVMAPTSDALLDFIGRALGGLPLLDA